jgi:hypothetical protein
MGSQNLLDAELSEHLLRLPCAMGGVSVVHKHVVFPLTGHCLPPRSQNRPDDGFDVMLGIHPTAILLMPALSASGNIHERAVVPMRYSPKKHRAEPAVPLLDRLEPGVQTLPSSSAHSSRPRTAAAWGLGLIDENRLPPLQRPVAPLLTPADSLGLVQVRNFGDNSFLEAEASLLSFRPAVAA